jgi:hypothetical protein
MHSSKCIGLILGRFISTRMSFISDVMQRISVWLQQDDVALRHKDGAQEPCTGGQDREDLHGHHDFPLGAVVDRQEGDLYAAEQHA